ncbi:hypothetical protein [Ralstonia wenshanensis]|uniref:Phage tail protein n=1 Tax=Ralstonia wenshanensis TaxID=2842456 RepID=A0AAD2ER24_9RALS|nr:hypothetical protein [Ralstonia wenshanensis]CAJ0696056.1 hypothetical protein LMG18091_02217 [Ralstonia wenshanensis]
MAGTTINITDAGRAALVNADHTGTAARKIVQAGIATAPFTFNAGLQALPNELKRLTTISGETIAADTVHATIRDDSADQYTTYGFGLYLDNGVLLGTYCQPTPIMEKAPVAILLLAVDMVFKQLDVTALSFGDAAFTNPPASTERQGVVELATAAETVEGADAQRAVTPAGLNARTGTEDRTGLVQLATEAEVVSGKDDGKAVTPRKLARQLAKKADLAGSPKQVFSVAPATATEHAVPLGQADERYATPASVKDAKDTATDALAAAKAALPRTGGAMTGIIDMTGPSNELRFTDNQQPITLGRFRLVSSGGMLIVDRNTAGDGAFSKFVRVCTIDGNGNMSTPAGIVADLFKTRANVNLPAHNDDGRGFLEFGGDTVIWRLFMPGPSGNLILNSYNTDGTNRHQPFYIDYVSGKFIFATRPAFNGATPWDTANLPNPLTTDGGWLNANRGLYFGVGYGRGALTVSSNGTDSIGGAFAEWNASRTAALQIDCPSNVGAYMGIRWTQWGMRHLAAIDCFAGGSDATVPYISMHVGGRVNAFTFGGSGTLVAQGDIHAGSGGGILASNGNVYMSWAGQWLSDYLTNLNNGKATKGATAQVNAVTEFSYIDISKGGNQTLDLPAPYVMCGLRNVGNTTIIYLRGTYLTQQ